MSPRTSTSTRHGLTVVVLCTGIPRAGYVFRSPLAQLAHYAAIYKMKPKLKLALISAFILLWIPPAWADDQQKTISISKLGTVTIEAHIDKSAAISAPFLTIERADGKLLKRTNFTLEGGGSYPSILKFKAVATKTELTPIIVAVASSPGGSDIHFETTLIGFHNGTIFELTPTHIESSSQNALCFEKNVAGRPLQIIYFNFLWEEAHYEPHRYEATLYAWSGNELAKVNVKETKNKHKNWKGASAELGYNCREDLIQSTNQTYK